MKQDFNNSMDSLLRDYARRHTSDFSIKRDVYALNEPLTGNNNDMKHLDADELAAFAENAVPSTARARYVAHLADCDACRRLIIDLRGTEIFASEIATQRPPHELKARPVWREKLAAFFATPSLRYVAPAFAASLLVALIVGIMAYRSREKAILVASKQETQANNKIYDAAANETQSALNSNLAPSSPVDQMMDAPSRGNVATTTTATTPNTATTNAPTTRPTANADSSIASKEARPSTATRNDSALNEALPNSAQSVAKLARQPVAGSEKSSADNAALSSKQETTAVAKSPPPPAASGNADMSANRTGVVTTQSEEVAVSSSQVANDAKNKALPVNGRNVSGADASGAAPSRRINGRDFRRQGNLWIDTAYADSQSTTNVARGSEQYRALVGEEPGIGKIAAQLDGEIIVVWKRRAYRIR